MAKPATDARLEAAAKGFTQVIGRGNAHIITRNPVTKKCAYDGQGGGGWHYNGDQETDTAWEQDAVAEYLKMVKAGYNLRARKLFNAGDLIQWIDPGSGQYVKFQPQNFQWIDGTTGSNSLISVAQAISAPTVDDDKLYWPAAFGSGRHFRYTAAPTKLIKHLIIDSAANIPACPTWITNPWLELTFTLTPSSGVIMYVDGLAWDPSTSKTTANAIEFRLPSGQVVWSMAAPLAYDSSEMGEPCNGQIKLYVNKKIKYCAVRFPKSWIDSAVFPIMLDPTLDYQIGAGGNDGYAIPDLAFDNTSAYSQLGRTNSKLVHNYSRFPSVTIPVGATIDVATYSLKIGAYACSGTPTVDVYAEDADNPAAPTTYSDLTGRTKTTAKLANWDVAKSDNAWYDADVKNVVEELQNSYDYSAGKAIIIICIGNQASGTNLSYPNTYEATGNVSGPKLHIEYTEAAAGKPAANVIWIG